MNTEPKVFVGMSGGVDSSTTAALLKEAGYDVTGVFIRVWQPPFMDCNWQEERRDAQRAAAHIGIPFTTIDLQDEYKREVVDYMIEEYRRGRTPNPDVMCNKHVKFGAFLRAAKERGADCIATGHYARIVEATRNVALRHQTLNKPQIQKKETQNTAYNLWRAEDDKKDQTYFLWTLGQEELAHTLFPLGGYLKSEVREMARERDLPVAEKRDSQGVCFIGKMDMKEFLKEYIDEQPGDVLNTSGEVIGRHDGAWFYTLGQRGGITLTAQRPDQQPTYVIKKDIEANTVTIAEPREGDSYTDTEATLEHVNWIANKPESGRYLCRFRHQQPLRPCTLEQNDETTITFDEPERAVTPGQSLVLYRNDGECVGGGVISS